MILCLIPAHSINCSFTNIVARWEPVGATYRPSASVSGDEDGPEFICCADGQQTKIHEVWTFGEDGVTPKVRPTTCVDVGAFVGECFATDCLTPTWRSIPMFGRNYINGSVEWLGIPNFLRNDGPLWNLNLLAPYANWGYKGSSTILNLVSGYGGYSYGVSINCNCPDRVLPIYHRRIF